MGSGDLNGGKQLSRESSPGKGSDKSKGPETWANSAYSGRERKPLCWDEVTVKRQEAERQEGPGHKEP